MRSKPLVAVAALATSLSGPLHAQNVESALGALPIENARSYLRPLTDGLTQSMTSASLTSARPLGAGGFSLDMRISGALFERGDASFEPVLPSSITWNGTSYEDPYEIASNRTLSPTAVGKGTGLVLQPRGGSAFKRDLVLEEENPNADRWRIELPDGFNIPTAPYAVIEATVGVGYGTQLTGSFFPSVKLSTDVGSVSAYGGTVMHSLNRYAPGLSIDLAGIAGYQHLEVGDYLTANATHLGVAASKSWTTVVVYAHGSVMTSSVEVRYPVANPLGNPALPGDGETVTFSADSGAQARLALGLTLDLVVFKLAGEYSIGAFNTFSGRVSLGLR
jgi:Family of unknown function (DUF6588)